MKASTENPKASQKDGNLIELTKRLPLGCKYAEALTERLNEKQLKSPKGLPYNVQMIYNAVNGRQKDDNIKKELIQYMAERVGKQASIDVLLDVAAELILQDC